MVIRKPKTWSGCSAPQLNTLTIVHRQRHCLARMHPLCIKMVVHSDSIQHLTFTQTSIAIAKDMVWHYMVGHSQRQRHGLANSEKFNDHP